MRELIIEAKRAEGRYWRDLWAYRELFIFLAWRDILVRYKQTVIGVAWAVIRPALTMVVFTIIFGRIAGLPADGVPYPILVFCATLPWYFFATSVADGANSLVHSANVVTKVYFPRLIVPASAVVVSVVDFLISLALFCLLLVWYQFLPSARVLFLPLMLLLTMSLSLGLVLVFAALNVRYRDFRHLLPFLIQLGLFISPVGFSLSAIPEEWRTVYSLNPMVGIIEGFRWCFLPGHELPAGAILLSACVSALLLINGLLYFRRTERSFADVI